jgi:Rrf2 family transcriptional regulator, iron-sulfur cluster assembly transcription factor
MEVDLLSQTSEHALRAVIYLAQQPRGRPIPAEELARALGAPANYLSKTLNVLAKQGVLGSVRGPRGGFWLEIPPESLTLAQVTGIFEETRRNPICLMGGRPCTDHAPCHLHFRWKALRGQTEAPLRETTVAELVGRDQISLEERSR